MNKTHKKLALLALTSLSVCMATIAFSTVNSGYQFASVLQADVQNLNVTFSSFSDEDGVAVCRKSLYGGGTIKAYTTTTSKSGKAPLSFGNYMFFAFENNGIGNDTKVINSKSYQFAPFSNLKSISFTNDTSYGRLTVYSSVNLTSWSSTEVTGSGSVNVSGKKYVYIQESNQSYSTISSITINYSCDTGGSSDYSDIENSLLNTSWSATPPGKATCIFKFGDSTSSGELKYKSSGTEYSICNFSWKVTASDTLVLTATSDASTSRYSFVNGNSTSTGDALSTSIAVTDDNVTSISATIYYYFSSWLTYNLNYTKD